MFICLFYIINLDILHRIIVIIQIRNPMMASASCPEVETNVQGLSVPASTARAFQVCFKCPH